MPTNTEIVQAASEAFGRGDIPGLLNMCSDNVEVIFFGDPSILQWAGHWKGKSRVAEYFRIIGETLDVQKWEPQHYVPGGDRVAAFGSTDVRVKATGKSVIGTKWSLDFSVGNGKVTGWQVYMDTAAFENALTATSKTSA